MAVFRLEEMQPHPEGGRFCEVFRSPAVVRATAGERSALTHIYFSLAGGEVSRFHRLTADEIWNLYEGELEMLLWRGDDSPPQRFDLCASARRFCMVAPAGVWQAARARAGGALIGASVAPGFEFSDFSMLRAGAPEAARLLNIAPDCGDFIAAEAQ